MNHERAYEAVVGSLMLYFTAKIIKEIPRLLLMASVWPIAKATIFIYASFNHQRWYHENK
jgi:hypothetical protein